MTAIPMLTLKDQEKDISEVLKVLQRNVLKHPAAAQALLSSFSAEGRKFSQTEQGRQLQKNLTESELLRRLWRLWEGTSLWMLDPDEVAILPSGFVDALFMSAASDDTELEIENLATGGRGDDRNAAK